MVPVVRYMILCHDWGVDPENSRLVNIYGLLSAIQAVEDPPYPYMMPELCIYVMLTETRGPGTAQIICTFEETGNRVFGTKKEEVYFANDPLAVVGLPFRILDCRFPEAGLYMIQFWYNDELVTERPLRLR